MKKLIFIIVYTAFTVFLTDARPLFAQNDKQIFGRINDYIENKKFFDTITELKALIKKEPKNKENYLRLAAFYARADLYKEEIKTLEALLKFLPEDDENFAGLCNNLAFAYLSDGQWAKVKAPLDKALALDPESDAVLFVLLLYQVHEKNFYGAAQTLDRLCRLNEETDFYHDLYQYLLDNDYPSEDIVRLYEETVKVSPQSHLSHRMLASVLRVHAGKTQEHLSRILEEFNTAIKLKPDYIPTYVSLANTYLFLALQTKDASHYQTAIKWLNKAKKINPDFARLYFAFGNIYQYMEQHDKAIVNYEKTVAMGLDDEKVFEVLGQAYNNKAYECYKTGKNLKEGLKVIDKAIGIDPFNGIFLGTKAELLYKMGQYEEAYSFIKGAKALDPNHEEIKQDLINIEKALKRSDHAQ